MKEIEILVEVKSTKEDALSALEAFDFQGAKQVLDVYFQVLHIKLYSPMRAGG